VARQREADAMLDHATPLGELFKDQLVAADLLVVNKADLVSNGVLDAVASRLRAEARPGTGVVRAHNGHVDIAALLGLGLASEDHLEGRDSAHELEHGGEGHEHDDFDSFSISLPDGLGRDELLGRIESAIRAHDVLRLKGFAALPGSDARLAIQAVGPRINAWFDRPWKPGEARQTGFVVIGESPLDRAAISARLLGQTEAAVAAE
jgi:cobalamin biosynthesis protein CobW